MYASPYLLRFLPLIFSIDINTISSFENRSLMGAEQESCKRTRPF